MHAWADLTIAASQIKTIHIYDFDNTCMSNAIGCISGKNSFSRSKPLRTFNTADRIWIVRGFPLHESSQLALFSPEMRLIVFFDQTTSHANGPQYFKRLYLIHSYGRDLRRDTLQVQIISPTAAGGMTHISSRPPGMASRRNNHEHGLAGGTSKSYGLPKIWV